MEHNFPIPVLQNKQRCHYVSIHLNCNVGGFGTIECFKPEFHADCRFRKKADDRYARIEESRKDKDGAKKEGSENGT